MIVWPVTSSRRITANSRTVLTTIGQFQATLSGVRTMKIDQDDDLDPEAAEARAALRLEVRRPCTGPARSIGDGGAASGRLADRQVSPASPRAIASAGWAPSGSGLGSGVWSVTGRNDTGGGWDAPYAGGATGVASQVGGQSHLSAEDA